MNYIWGFMMLISVITAIATGRVDETVNAVFDGAKTSTQTIIALAGAICFWSGIMKIAEKSGISDFLNKLCEPLVKFLFPGSGEDTRRYICMNITANFLGLGNAATPMGMLAAKGLDKENMYPEKPSCNMCMLVVLNTTAFQLMPTTIIAMRAAVGSQNPTSIIFPIWIVSMCGIICSVTAVKIYFKKIKNE